jgi:type I restriction enzyme M protein
MVDEEGYLILIQLLAIKIFDEKQSDVHGSYLQFFIADDERVFRRLDEAPVQTFIRRLSSLYEEARRYYRHLLDRRRIDWTNESHMRVISEIVNELQSFSFARSRKTDLYQLVFYNFATAFKKDEHAQFLTPLPIISFLVDIVNPRRNETVLDPCCGTGDFLSVSYVSSTANWMTEICMGWKTIRKWCCCPN